MSAVDDVDARLCRLEEAYQLTQTQLLELSTQRMYNPTLGVDQDRNGHSVATLEITVIAARNMMFQSGLLAGKGAYVRATLEPRLAALDQEMKCTQKRAIAGTPWLMIEVLQEERFGADRVVGAVGIDVAILHDQRLNEQWHALTTKDNQPTYGQLYLGCRLNRSQIFALEVESELLQNQITELRDFVHRQKRFSLSLPFGTSSSTTFTRTPSDRSLDGKEVKFASIARTPPRQRITGDAHSHPNPRYGHGPMHSPVLAARKRERRMSSAAGGPMGSGNGQPMDVDMAQQQQQQPRVKRRKLVPVAEPSLADSLSSRLANWLLPTASTAQIPVAQEPQQQQQVSFPFATASPATANRRRLNARTTVHNHKKKHKPTTSFALHALENWLFQDVGMATSSPTTAASSVDRIHAQMRAES